MHNREIQLQEEIAQLESRIDPLKEELHTIWKQKSNTVKERINLADMGKGNFQLDELVFAATSKCDCGAGLCYPKDIGPSGAWYCSDILRGLALPANQEGSKSHADGFPFNMYSIKSEDQPSAYGATTRPTTEENGETGNTVS